MSKLTLNDVDWSGKRVFVRVDYNVPLKEQAGQMVITDLSRITATLPTLAALTGAGARCVLASHLGRPEGQREPSMSLRPVAAKLAGLLGRPVEFAEDCLGAAAREAAEKLPPGGVLLLENVRFYQAEEKNDPEFAGELAGSAEAYVNDAFGSAHRAHASTEGVARVVASRGGPCAAGLLMEKELRFLGQELEDPARPFVVILGGAKVSDKLKVITRLLQKADTLLIGGAMAYTFRLAQGAKVGKSRVEADRTQVALDALAEAKARNVKLLLPTDDVVATPVNRGKVDKKGRPVTEFENPRPNTTLDLPPEEAGLDIGPATCEAFAREIGRARTILWNGPLGMFEDARFAAGTLAIARAVADATRDSGAKSIIGGGDSVTAVNQAGLGERVTWMSTGGGASLEFLEGRVLPGVAALSDRA